MKVSPYPLWGRWFDSAQRCSVICVDASGVRLSNNLKNIDKEGWFGARFDV